MIVKQIKEKIAGIYKFKMLVHFKENHPLKISKYLRIIKKARINL